MCCTYFYVQQHPSDLKKLGCKPNENLSRSKILFQQNTQELQIVQMIGLMQNEKPSQIHSFTLHICMHTYMCMSVCMYVYIYQQICMDIYVCMYVYKYTYYTHPYIVMMNECMCTCMYVYVCMLYGCIHSCMYIGRHT